MSRWKNYFRVMSTILEVILKAIYITHVLLTEDLKILIFVTFPVILLKCCGTPSPTGSLPNFKLRYFISRKWKKGEIFHRTNYFHNQYKHFRKTFQKIYCQVKCILWQSGILFYIKGREILHPVVRKLKLK